MIISIGVVKALHKRKQASFTKENKLLNKLQTSFSKEKPMHCNERKPICSKKDPMGQT